jgi:hypothetical protein
VPFFKAVEVAFLQEYCLVMKPLSCALDILQAEKNCFYGMIIPTIISLQEKLKRLQNDVKHVLPLIKAISNGLERRFEMLLTDEMAIVATVCMPQFKLRWCREETEGERAKKLLKTAMMSLSAIGWYCVECNVVYLLVCVNNAQY